MNKVESLVIDDEIMVQANDKFLFVMTGKMMDQGFMYEPKDTQFIVPGKPMADLLPLHEHKAEISKMVLRALKGPKVMRTG